MQKQFKFRMNVVALGVMAVLGCGQSMAQTTVVQNVADVYITGNNDSSTNYNEGVFITSNSGTGAVAVDRAYLQVLTNGQANIYGSSSVNINGSTTNISGSTTNISSANDLLLNADTDNGGYGEVIISSYNGGGTHTTLTVGDNGITSNKSLTVQSGGASITGGINNNSDGITNAGNISGAGSITSTGNATIATGANTTNTLGSGANSINTIGNAGTSVNTLTGATNAITSTTTNAITAGTTNTITGGTGNSVTATTGNNTVTATAGSNVISANAASQSNTLSATGSNGANYITANASTGTNNIEAKTNNIGVATSASINTIGNATTSANTMQGATNAITGTTSINASVNYATNINTGSNTQAVTIGNNGLSTTNTVTAKSGNTTLSLQNNVASLTAGGTLATNGTSGTTSASGSGGLTVYNSAQTVTNSVAGVVTGKSYQNLISGNMFVDGNVYINGTLDYVSSNAANTSVIGSGTGTSKLAGATTSTSGGTAIVMKGTSVSTTQTLVDANGKLSTVPVGSTPASESTASLTLTNGLGNTHGVVVTESQATISGGTHSSSMTLDDNGATFSNSANGAPIKVTGVADGTTDFDAVNVRQFAQGIAAVTAIASIPAPEAGKDAAIGVGLGNHRGQSAIAFGLNYRMPSNGLFKASVATGLGNGNRPVVGLGAGWSW